MTDVRTAQKIACEDMMRDVAKLAREAEEVGAPPQGAVLAEYAECIARGDIRDAMKVRDRIFAAGLKAARRDYRHKTIRDWVVGVWDEYGEVLGLFVIAAIVVAIAAI